MSRPLFLLLSLLIAQAAFPALAWGPLGHRLVARLAEYDLDPAARAEIARLLEGEADPTLAGVANWADDLRDTDPAMSKATWRWHFVNIADHDCRYEPARDCPDGNCVIEAIHRQSAILADRRKPKAERLRALKFVVHFVGDVHQPLHAGYARDRGGNDFQTHYRGKGSNLHSVWDSGLLASRRLDEEAYLRELRALPMEQKTDLPASGAAAVWAQQSCAAVTAPGFYPTRARLEDAYYDRHRPQAEQSLRLGGRHLAQLLNAALATH